MSWPILGGAAMLAVLAAAGVLRPLWRPRRVLLERLADPVDDRRLALLRSLTELERERSTGTLGEEDYLALRRETESRAVATLRASEGQDNGDGLAASLREIRTMRRDGHRPRPNRAKVLWSFLLAAALVGASVPALIKGTGARPSSDAISDAVAGPSEPLSLFEDRVQAHPDDVAARLDLAERYLDAGDVRQATVQYLAALSVDPNNAEAHTKLGFLLFQGGLVPQALSSVNRALAVDGRYPEALFIKGLILAMGLGRSEAAARMFRTYLEVAPFGSHRAEAERLLTLIANSEPVERKGAGR
ncbi:MAG: tetratricopeptide repeat protein [Actinomycetota bacterium]